MTPYQQNAMADVKGDLERYAYYETFDDFIRAGAIK